MAPPGETWRVERCAARRSLSHLDFARVLLTLPLVGCFIKTQDSGANGPAQPAAAAVDAGAAPRAAACAVRAASAAAPAATTTSDEAAAAAALLDLKSGAGPTTKRAHKATAVWRESRRQAGDPSIAEACRAQLPAAGAKRRAPSPSAPSTTLTTTAAAGASPKRRRASPACPDTPPASVPTPAPGSPCAVPLLLDLTPETALWLAQAARQLPAYLLPLAAPMSPLPEAQPEAAARPPPSSLHQCAHVPAPAAAPTAIAPAPMTPASAAPAPMAAAHAAPCPTATAAAAAAASEQQGQSGPRRSVRMVRKTPTLIASERQQADCLLKRVCNARLPAGRGSDSSNGTNFPSSHRKRARAANPWCGAFDCATSGAAAAGDSAATVCPLEVDDGSGDAAESPAPRPLKLQRRSLLGL
jgi:hypothetical protein